MTAQEAIKYLKITRTCAELKKDSDGELQKRMCGVAIKALEKQIPRKPDVIDDDLGFFECPSCKTAIHYGADKTGHKYCLSCGIKLDWGDKK